MAVRGLLLMIVVAVSLSLGAQIQVNERTGWFVDSRCGMFIHYVFTAVLKDFGGAKS